MSGGTVHASVASNSVRASQSCPNAVDHARRNASVPEVSAGKFCASDLIRIAAPSITSSGEAAARIGECRVRDRCGSQTIERRGSMVRTPEWQRRFDGFDFSDFAQEFLRRNPAYKDQYAGLHVRDTGDKKPSAAQRMARSWGLEFPVRSECFGRRQPGDLEKRCERKRRYRGWRRPGPCRNQRHIG